MESDNFVQRKFCIIRLQDWNDISRQFHVQKLTIETLEQGVKYVQS